LKKVRLKTQIILNALDCPDGELSIVIVDDSQIEVLNSQYRHRNEPTNVIAFPMREGRFTDITPFLLGDVVVSVESADKEAEASGIDFITRFEQLLVHGILHLFGYDHENDEPESLRMETKSIELLELIKTI